MNFTSTRQNTQTRVMVCDTHGPFPSRQFFEGSVWSKCPDCNHKDDPLKRNDAAAIWQRKIENAGIPKRFENRSLSNYVASSDAQARALDFAREYADTFNTVLTTGRSALFIGRPGTGKTHLAIAIALHIMQCDNRTVLYTTVLRAIRKIKDTWCRNSDVTESHAIASLVLPDLLILDEVGVQHGTETERLILFDVLNERYEQRKPAVLLSNLPLDEMKDYLGERIYDRLREDGGEALPFDWESFRGQQFTEKG